MDALHDSLHGSVLDRDVLSPPWSALGRDLTLGLVSGLGKLLLRGLNTLHVEPDGLQRFRDLTMQREEGIGLLTYSNHTRCGPHAAPCSPMRPHAVPCS
jgi:hypothetical protein